MNGTFRGLPERLPPGERLLWQGAPDAWVLARRVFHIRKIALYFALIVAWMTGSSIAAGEPLAETCLTVAKAAGVALVPLAVIVAYAWLVARGTVYTITDRRLVMRVGIALPVTINLPFLHVADAHMNRRADGTGDVALALAGRQRVAFAVLWPHARPWRFAKSEPMLRGLRDVQPVAQILARALAASADMAAPVLDTARPDTAAMPHAAAAA